VDDVLTFADVMEVFKDLRRRVADVPAAIYVSPELYFEFNERITESNSAYWPGGTEPESPRIMLPSFYGLPVTIDPDLHGNEWYTVDVDNNIIALHVARPGIDPVEYGTLTRKDRNERSRN